MSEIVFILGAGASRDAGAPLMNDFLDTAEDLLRSGSLPAEAKTDFDLVFKALAALHETQSKARIEWVNLEDVFAGFEMAALLGRLGRLEREEVERLPAAMHTLIAVTLENTIAFPTRQNEPRPLPQPSYAHFVDLVVKLSEGRDARRLDKVTTITFNYDCCLDYALYHRGFVPDYCLQGPGNLQQSHRLLKLHGSLNWGRCPDCESILALDISDHVKRNFGYVMPGRGRTVKLRMASDISQQSHCHNEAMIGPVVVPPTWNKGQHHAQLARVWQQAATELAEAENIYVCGYSLPDTDQFFRYLYALGTTSSARIKRFWVFDPHEAEIRQRYSELLGTGASPRFGVLKSEFSQLDSAILGPGPKPT